MTKVIFFYFSFEMCYGGGSQVSSFELTITALLINLSFSLGIWVSDYSAFKTECFFCVLSKKKSVLTFFNSKEGSTIIILYYIITYNI